MTRDKALKILGESLLTEEESKELFTEVLKRLESNEEEMRRFYEMPECTDKFKSQERFYSAGIRLFEILGIEKRIRK